MLQPPAQPLQENPVSAAASPAPAKLITFRRKASLTLNPLGNPQSAIQALAVEIQGYLHFPDPAPLYVTMGAVAANMMPGAPVWLMLIGPPSCGKTVLLDTLSLVPRIHAASTIKGEAVLLSAVGKRDRTAQSTGGLLRQVGDRGAIVIKDFTSMISMPHDALATTMAAFREIYDGKWDRAVGADGGYVASWEGRIAMLAACTPVIDRHHQISNDMGERWVYYRFPESDGYVECNKALGLSDQSSAKLQTKQLVRDFFSALNLDWDTPTPKRKFTEPERQRLIAISTFAARARSAVPRNSYSREVEETPQRESPTRLSTALGQLYLGMELVGVEPGECWRIVSKIGLDCMPQARLRVLERLREAESIAAVDSTIPHIGIGALEEAVQCSRSNTRRTAEDLELHGLIDSTMVTGGKEYRLSRWAKEELERGWGRGWREMSWGGRDGNWSNG